MKLLPENHFEHSLASVKRMGEHYGIVVSNYAEADSGIENTTLIVEGTTGRYAFRIYRRGHKTDAQIHAEIDFVQYLGANGVPVPTILSNRLGEPLTIFESGSQSWQMAVMEFIDGAHPKSGSAELLADMATTQARMHKLAASYTGNTVAVRKLTVLVEKEFIQQIDRTELDDALRAFLERGANYRVMPDPNLESGICHLDYDEFNILCKDQHITAILDFDDMAIAPYAVCLAYTLWHIQDRQGSEAADSYLRIYEQIQPLTDAEKHFLPAAMLFRHYMITAIKILDGETSSENIRNYLQVEQLLQSRILT